MHTSYKPKSLNIKWKRILFLERNKFILLIYIYIYIYIEKYANVGTIKGLANVTVPIGVQFYATCWYNFLIFVASELLSTKFEEFKSN